MTPVLPDASITQRTNEVVVYQLPLVPWNGSLQRAREGQVTVQKLKGDPVYVQALPPRDRVAQQVRVQSGHRPGKYRIVRVVTDGVETLKRSFTLRVI